MIKCRAGSAARLRARVAEACSGRVDHAHSRASDSAEMNDIPDAAPRDQRRDAEGADAPVEPVDDPRARDVPVADLVVAEAWVNPGRTGRDDHAHQPGGR